MGPVCGDGLVCCLSKGFLEEAIQNLVVLDSSILEMDVGSHEGLQMFQTKPGMIPAIVQLVPGRSRVVCWNLEYGYITVESSVVDPVEKSLSVFWSKVVPLSGILVQRLGCLLEQNGVRLLVEI